MTRRESIPINRQRAFALPLLVAAVLLAACGGRGPEGTPLPTPTPSPIATGLPTVPPPLPVGVEENPFVLVMVPAAGDREAAQAAAQTLALLLSWWPDSPPTAEPTAQPAESPTAAAITESEAPTPTPVLQPEELPTPQPTPTPAFHVSVRLVDTYAEVVEQVCGHDAPVAGWVDGWAYLRAEGSGCAAPRYVALGEGGEVGVQAMIVRHVPFMAAAAPDDEEAEGEQPEAQAARAVTSVADLAGGRFCRLRYDDAQSWLIPALMLKAAGVDPLTGLGSVTDYASLDDLIRAVYLGACDAAGLPPDALDGQDLETLALDKFQPTVDPFDPADAAALAAAEVVFPPLDQVVVPLQTSPEVPTAVMIYPAIVQHDARIRVEDALMAALGSPEGADALETLLGARSLRPAERSDFNALRTLMTRAGLDPVALGR